MLSRLIGSLENLVFFAYFCVVYLTPANLRSARQIILRLGRVNGK